jgi:ankyrin repeat protein
VLALSLAALGGDILMTELLINYRANTEVRNMGLSTPYLRNLFLLYLNVRNAYEREEAAYTPLEGGAYQGYEKIEQILFDWGARKGISLFLAVAQGHIGVVDILISRGADIESRNTARLTPLACAAGKGKVDMVKWLLKKGADVNSRSAMGWTAIKLAVQLKEAAVVRVLLKNGAYPEGEQDLDERMILWPKKKKRLGKCL